MAATEARRVVWLGRQLLWLAPLLFVLMVTFNIVTVRLGLSALPQLANVGFQLAKLDAVERIDTVFLGDSSLGRMIDMSKWQALSGETSLSLALTGGEGYVGDLYILQQILRRHRPGRVVLVHTPDMLTRNIAWSAYFVLRPDAPSIDPPFERWVRDQIGVYLSADLFMASLKGILMRFLDRSLPFFEDGYVSGKPALFVRRRFDPKDLVALEVDDVNPDKTLFLDLVAGLCRREGLDCVYAFGPIWDAVCANSEPYFDVARELVAARGIPVVSGTPICVPLDDLDDTEDHIAWSTRPHYTAEFHARLEAFERQRRTEAGAP
jgi:hypothetical protein